MTVPRFLPIALGLLGSIPAIARKSPVIRERSASQAAQLVPAALTGCGVWQANEYHVATGHSKSVDSLRGERAGRLERRFAGIDARRRLLTAIAKERFPEFSSESYDLHGTLQRAETVAIYLLPGREGTFVTIAVPSDGVSVSVEFDPEKARNHALRQFESGRWHRAAATLAELTRRGIRDREVVELARAASAHVNLEAGVRGESRAQALDILGRFHHSRRQWERSLRHYFDLYSMLPEPGADLLDRLAKLCTMTGRHENAEAFRTEAEST